MVTSPEHRSFSDLPTDTAFCPARARLERRRTDGILPQGFWLVVQRKGDDDPKRRGEGRELKKGHADESTRKKP